MLCLSQGEGHLGNSEMAAACPKKVNVKPNPFRVAHLVIANTRFKCGLVEHPLEVPEVLGRRGWESESKRHEMKQLWETEKLIRQPRHGVIGEK